jgi:hypothetical protein
MRFHFTYGDPEPDFHVHVDPDPASHVAKTKLNFYLTDSHFFNFQR